MGKFLFIGLLAVLAIVYIGIGFGMFHYMKRITVNGNPLIEQPVNGQERTDKMGSGEFLVYFSGIVIAGLLVVQVMQKDGAGSSILAKTIMLPPIMALFNARKRTGKSMVALIVSFMAVLFLMMANMLIGLPQKAPVLTVGETTIVIAQTTVADVMEEGFDIYVHQSDDSHAKHDELLSSGVFKKYPADRSVFVEEGFREDGGAIADASYLLVKDHVVIGSITPYGSKTEDVVLEDCKIVCVNLDEDSIAAAKADSLSMQLEGIDLLAPLEKEALIETFGEKLWHVPSAPKDITALWYGIGWTNNSEHIFWNEYSSYIRFDEGNNMTSFELKSLMAE